MARWAGKDRYPLCPDGAACRGREDAGRAPVFRPAKEHVGPQAATGANRGRYRPEARFQQHGQRLLQVQNLIVTMVTVTLYYDSYRVFVCIILHTLYLVQYSTVDEVVFSAPMNSGIERHPPPKPLALTATTAAFVVVPTLFSIRV